MVRVAISEGAATKEDVARLENRIDAGVARPEDKIDSDIAGVKTDIGGMKSGIGGLETRLAVRMYGGLGAAVVVLLAFLKLLP